MSCEQSETFLGVFRKSTKFSEVNDMLRNRWLCVFGLRAALVLVAASALGCFAHSRGETDWDKTPVISAGAGATIIYPGQTMPTYLPPGGNAGAPPGSGYGAPSPGGSPSAPGTPWQAPPGGPPPTTATRHWRDASGTRLVGTG